MDEGFLKTVHGATQVGVLGPGNSETWSVPPRDISFTVDEDTVLDLPDDVEYVFDEPYYLREYAEYVDSTYGAHYASGRIQATEAIESAGFGVGFTAGNIIKYAMRLGKKEGWNRKDVLKIIHYGFLLLHAIDNDEEVTAS